MPYREFYATQKCFTARVKMRLTGHVRVFEKVVLIVKVPEKISGSRMLLINARDLERIYRRNFHLANLYACT